MGKITLKAARINAGYTMQDVASRFGVCRETVGKWERGVISPQVVTFNKLCDLYGVTGDDVLFCTPISKTLSDEGRT